MRYKLPWFVLFVKVVHEWVRACTASNIPLSKSDHPAIRNFLHQRVKNGGAIPGAHQLQEAYLPDVYSVERQKLIEYMAHKKIAVIFDEMSDDEGRFVLNILFAPLIKNNENKIVSFLVDTVFLAKTDHTTVSQAVVKTLHLYGIEFCDVIVFDTDNAAYMKKAYQSVLAPLFPNSVHITCLAHIINLVGESFRSPFVGVDEFVRAFSQMFFMAGARKGRYLQHLKTHKTDTTTVTMPPDPCATRWNSWYFAVQCHAKNFNLYKGFIDSELTVCGKSAPQSVQTLNTILSSDNAMCLAAQIIVIAEKCQPILHILDKLESHTPCTMDVFEWLEEMQMYLESHAQLSNAIYSDSFDALSLDNRQKNC